MPPPPTPPTRTPATARRVADETNGHGVVVSASELLCRAGDRAFFGWGEPRSREKALDLYARAASDASSPCASAMRRLGRCYEEGAGVAPDPDAAASWNEAAAALGDPDATCATARVVERAGDLRGAGERYQFAADEGHAGAAFELGRMYANGLGVRKDAEAAAYWYQLAAEHGDAAAQRAVGVAGMEAANENEANDPAAAAAAAREAIEWLERAAAQGDADALNDLAIVHEDGHAIAAIPRDAEKARGLYSRAAERGHPRARNNLGFVYMASEAYADAAVHFRIAANEGDADAMNNLGNLVENGLGVPKDLREARWMYERAAAAGVDKAREAAARVSETIRSEDAEEMTRARDSALASQTSDANAPGASEVSKLNALVGSFQTMVVAKDTEIYDARRETSRKDAEAARIAKELGAAKAECARLKASLAAYEKSSKAPSPLGLGPSSASGPGPPIVAATAVRSEHTAPGGLSSRPRFERSSSLRSDRSGASGVSAISSQKSLTFSAMSTESDDDGARSERSQGGQGARGAVSSGKQRRVSTSGGSRPSSAATRRPSRANTAPIVSSASGGNGGGGGKTTTLASIFGKAFGGKKAGAGGGAGGGFVVDHDAIARASKMENDKLKRSLEAYKTQAELHEGMCVTLGEVLKTTYARNLQLEDLLRDLGVDVDDPESLRSAAAAATTRALTEIAVTAVAGVDVSELEEGRALGEGGLLRGASFRSSSSSTPRGEASTEVAALPSPPPRTP